MRAVHHWGLVSSVAAALVAFPGCGRGDPDAVPAVPAAGTVTYKGKPVESGSIQFVPAKGRPATGEIKDGRFTLTTYNPDDGAIPGEHKVAVNATREVPSPKGGEPDVVYLVPEAYANHSTTSLNATVPPAGNKEMKFELSGEVSGPGARPPVSHNIVPPR